MKYYFLVSYLPDIQRDDKKIKIRLSDLLSERYLFSEKDFVEIELLLLAGDILQVERLLAGKDVTVEYCLYGRDFWKEQIKSPKEVPEHFLGAFEALIAEGLTPKNLDNLYEAYYVYAIEKTRSPLLKKYLAFEKELRNIVAALRARKMGLSPSDFLVGEGDTVDILTRSNAEDFTLSNEYPWMERLLSAREPEEMENAVQSIIWDTLDEMTQHLDFEFDVVLAYLLKLQILERNLAMSGDRGMEAVRQMEEL